MCHETHLDRGLMNNFTGLNFNQKDVDFSCNCTMEIETSRISTCSSVVVVKHSQDGCALSLYLSGLLTFLASTDAYWLPHVQLCL